MNLDELQSVQARERQSSDLQHLRSSFYSEVGSFIATLNEQRARAVEAADDPFSEPEVRRLTDDIETAESTVEAIYERRVGKVVKKASIAAAGMPVEEDGLTSEESDLFETLVARIEENRETVLSTIDDDAPSVSCSVDDDGTEAVVGDQQRDESQFAPDAPSEPEPPTANDGVSAADLMGDTSKADSGGETAAPGPSNGTSGADSSTDSDVPSVEAVPPDSAPPVTDSDTGDAAPADDPLADTSTTERTRSDPPTTSPSDSSSATGRTEPDSSSRTVGVPRTTVRITANVGEIVGADDRDYDLDEEDVVTLPEPNADVLVEKNAAERL